MSGRNKSGSAHHGVSGANTKSSSGPANSIMSAGAAASESDFESSYCLLCAEEIDHKHRLEAFGACNHRGVCAVCFARLRGVMRDRACPVCKQEQEMVICSAEAKSFQSFEIFGYDLGPEYTFDERSHMFYPKHYFRHDIQPLWVPRCSLCKEVRKDAEALRKHVMADHKDRIMCLLCINNLKCFPNEFKIYSKDEYEKHVRTGDKCGSQGHPNCEFCRTRYFDKHGLFMHLHKDHFTCHICEKMGINFRYYEDYNSLESHFRRDHCLCEDALCLDRKFVVFASEVELAQHQRQWHPDLKISRNIPIKFKSYRDRKADSSQPSSSSSSSGRRRGGGGDDADEVSRATHFDGGVAGMANGGEWQLELERIVDPREATSASSAAASSEAFNYAAAIAASRAQASASSRAEDFPSLPPSESGQRGGPQNGSWGKSLVKQPPKVAKSKRGQPQEHASIRLVESFNNDLSLRDGPSAPPPPPASDYPPLPSGPSWSSTAVSSTSVRSERDYPPLPGSSASFAVARGGVSSSAATRASAPAAISSVHDYPTLPSSGGGKKGRLVQKFEAGKVSDESASQFKDIRSSLMSRGAGKGPSLSAYGSWTSSQGNNNSTSISMQRSGPSEDDYPALARVVPNSGIAHSSASSGSNNTSNDKEASQPSKQALKQAAKKKQREELRNLAFLK